MGSPTLTGQRGDSYGGDGVTLTTDGGGSTAPTATVIWLHGLGDTAMGWHEPLGQMLVGLGCPATGILPTAPERPITLNGGMSMPGWFDMASLEPPPAPQLQLKSSVTGPPYPEDRAGTEQSAERVAEIVRGEVARGVRPERILVGGFSQGGALALHVALRSALPLGGAVACSGWLPLWNDYPEALGTPARAGGLPVLQAHGDEDQVVALGWGRASHELLALPALGLGRGTAEAPSPAWLTYEGMAHSACPEELADVGGFMRSTLARTAADPAPASS